LFLGQLFYVILIADAAIEHVKRALVVDGTRIDDQTFPRLLGIRRENGIAGILFKFHGRKGFNQGWLVGKSICRSPVVEIHPT